MQRSSVHICVSLGFRAPLGTLRVRPPKGRSVGGGAPRLPSPRQPAKLGSWLDSCVFAEPFSPLPGPPGLLVGQSDTCEVCWEGERRGGGRDVMRLDRNLIAGN